MLHSFDNPDDALRRDSYQHANGTFFGTTIRGGSNIYLLCGGTCGTIFNLSLGLTPISLKRNPIRRAL